MEYDLQYLLREYIIVNVNTTKLNFLIFFDFSIYSPSSSNSILIYACNNRNG